jgi:hypothetical protein
MRTRIQWRATRVACPLKRIPPLGNSLETFRTSCRQGRCRREGLWGMLEVSDHKTFRVSCIAVVRTSSRRASPCEMMKRGVNTHERKRLAHTGVKFTLESSRERKRSAAKPFAMFFIFFALNCAQSSLMRLCSSRTARLPTAFKLIDCVPIGLLKLFPYSCNSSSFVIVASPEGTTCKEQKNNRLIQKAPRQWL